MAAPSGMAAISGGATAAAAFPSNYGEFLAEQPLALYNHKQQQSTSSSLSSSSKGYLAKEELNLLAKLIRCDEEDNNTGREKQQIFRINLFDTAGVDMAATTTSNQNEG